MQAKPHSSPAREPRQHDFALGAAAFEQCVGLAQIRGVDGAEVGVTSCSKC